MSKNGITFTVNSEFKSFRDLIKQFPQLRMAFLSSIGKQGRITLKGALFSRQALDPTKYPKDIAGRFTVSNRIRKGDKIVFSSYPVNLFERGRTLRNGKKEAPKRIITGKFKAMMEGKLQSLSDRAFNRVIKKHIEAI